MVAITLNVFRSGDVRFIDTRVAPDNIIFWRPDSLPRNDKPHYPTFWELGRGFGHISGVVDWREIGHRLRTLASTHGANVVAYQISGKEIRVQFLRVTDDIFETVSGQKNIQPSR